MGIINFHKRDGKIGYEEPAGAPLAGPKENRSFIKKLFADRQDKDKMVRPDALMQKYQKIVKTVDRLPRTDEDILGELDKLYKDSPNKKRV